MIERQNSYFLSVNKEAMDLYLESRDALIDSDCYDFMVYKFSDFSKKGFSEDWEHQIPIDEETYSVLHLNLCSKLGGILSERFKKEK